MSIPFNVVKTEKERVSDIPVNLATSFNSGDMMKWDDTNKIVTPVVSGDAASAAAAALFVGVSNDTNPIPSLNQNLPASRITVITRAMCQFTADDNAVYNPGDAVCFGAGAQLVRHTAASGAAVIGYVAGENVFPVVAGVTQGIQAVQGVTPILVNLRPQFTRLSTI